LIRSPGWNVKTSGSKADARALHPARTSAFRPARKKNPRTGKRRNLCTFKTLAAAKRHERAVQFFKRH